jgi:hypothetical protein
VSNWHDHIPQHFREPIHRLTLVADPDGLMLEEELLAAIRQNSFDLLPFVNDVRLSERFEVARQGLDLEMVAAGMTRR